MLYEGAIRFLERALGGFKLEDPAEFNQTISNNILRAQDIIFELNVTLNIQEGGELAMTLRQLYDYLGRKLTEANLQKVIEPLQEVLKRLSVLRDAWAQMLISQGQPAEIPAAERRGVLAAA
jgi:flagellar protein FliS